MTTYTVDLTITGKIEGTITGGGDGGGTPPPDPIEPPPDPIEPPPSGHVVEVGPTRQIKEPADASLTLPVGGTIIMDDGRYLKAFHVENEGITIRSASGNPYKCYFDGQGGYGGGHKLAFGKGMLHTGKSATVIGVGFRNCGSPQSGDTYSNESGIWAGDTGGSIPVRIEVERCAFDGNANGCFAPAERNITFLITESLFGYIDHNGKNAAFGGGGSHPAHDMYIQCGSLEVTKSMFWGCASGHNVKSRALTTNVHDNSCMTQDGGRVLDVSDGGDAKFNNNVAYTRKDRINQSPKGAFGNANLIAYAGESTSAGTQGLKMSGNTLHISRNGSTIWANAGTTITSTSDTVKYYEDGSLHLNGNVPGLAAGSAPPGSPTAPALPKPPTWATP